MHRSYVGPSSRLSSILLLLAMLLALGFVLSHAEPAHAATPLTACGDNLDNDGDGRTDYPIDPGCTSRTSTSEVNSGSRACADGVDNEVVADNKIDYPYDPGCASARDNDETDPAALPQCSNYDPLNPNPNGDDDGDLAVDFPSDPGCISASDNTETDTQCSNGGDDDGDGKVDFPTDLGCMAPTGNSALAADQPDNSETDPVQCNDGRDNDGDGWIDFNPGAAYTPGKDPGCTSAVDPTEAPNPPACSDGKDNDADGKIDFPTDPGCSSAADTDEADPGAPPTPPPACSDSIDNDLDGKIDFPADPGCASAVDTDETDPPKTVPPPIVPITTSTTTPPPPPPPTTTTPIEPISPFPVVRLRGRADRRGVFITLLRVQAPRGTKVTIYCKGTTCPLRRKSETTVTGFVRPKQFERRLRAGTTLTIYVTKSGFIGKYTRFKIMRGRAPSRVDSCARFAGTKPVACPAN